MRVGAEVTASRSLLVCEMDKKAFQVEGTLANDNSRKENGYTTLKVNNCIVDNFGCHSSYCGDQSC